MAHSVMRYDWFDRRNMFIPRDSRQGLGLHTGAATVDTTNSAGP